MSHSVVIGPVWPTVPDVSVNPGWSVAVALVILMVLTVVAYAAAQFPGARRAVVAGARAVAQLSVAALVIATVIRTVWLSVALVTVMFAVAVWTTTRRVHATHAWPYAALAMAAGLLPVLVVIFATGTVPFTGIAVVPVAGILIGNTMNAHTLVGRRCFDALREERGQYEAALSVGLSRGDAVGEVIHRRVPEALIPGLDQVRTAGVVTLPGAFIGVMLGGGSPAQAAAAQLLVLFGIMAAQTITAGAQERLIRSGRLQPAELLATLPR